MHYANLFGKKTGIIALFFLGLILFSSYAYAGYLDVDVVHIDPRLAPNHDATYNVTITNYLGKTESIGMGIDSVRVRFLTEPTYIYKNEIRLLPGESINFILKITAIDILAEGSTNINFWVYARNEKKTYDKFILVRYTRDLIYDDADVSIKINVPEVISIYSKNVFAFQINNNNPKHLENVQVKISGLFDFETATDIEPNAVKTVSLSKDLGKEHLGNKKIKIEIFDNGKLLASQEKSVEVSEYFSTFQKDESVEKKFLQKITKITLTNKNIEKTTGTLEIPLKKANLFTRFSEKPAKAEREGIAFYEWKISLNPKESKTIELVDDYRILIFIPIIAAAIILFIIIFGAPLSVKKEAKSVDVEDGGVSKIKVTISLKNMSSKKLKNVKIVEKLPLIVEVIPESFIVKPFKQYKYEKGCAIVWNVDEMLPKDEIIITYEVKTKINVIGDVRISPTITQYQTQDGNIVRSYSNKLTLSEGQETD